MSAVWTAIIGDAWTTFQTMMGDFTPIIALGVGLAIFGIVAAVIMGRR